MKPRPTLEDRFSSFVQFADDQFSGWVADPRLRRNMQQALDQARAADASTTSDEYWVLYWYQGWQTRVSPLAEGHLCAYVQEPCYWVARTLTAQIPGPQYRLSDCFQTAIATLPRILSRYNPDQSSNLKAFVSVSFGNTIRDRLRQQGEADRRTDWGLLRKVSQKRLEEALATAGLSPDAIASACLAWRCFKTVWSANNTPATRQLTQPTPAAWEAIATLYNQQRSTLPPPQAATTPGQLETQLRHCAQYVRDYLYPAVMSLNLPRPDSTTGELLDQIPDRILPPLADLINQETLATRQTQQAQLHDVLTQAITTLTPEGQTLLSLYYAQGLTQQQIADQLDMKQYTVSRRLSHAKETLLRSLAQWSQDTLHISLTSTVVKDMNTVLEEWLQHRYQRSAPPSLER